METASSHFDNGLPASPLLRLPFEVRLMIYEYLLLPSTTPSTGNGTSVANLLPDFHTYQSEDTNNNAFMLSVRTIDPWFGAQGPRTWRRRSTYHIRTGPFLTTTTPTTYRVLLSPYTAHLRHTIPSLLLLNSQIHAEASKVLYSTYTFSFHMSIEAIVPFLSDLTPHSLAAIRHISLTKKALPYTKEFDRAEWKSMCEFLAGGVDSKDDDGTIEGRGRRGGPAIRLHTLALQIIAGKPELGWDEITPMQPLDFDTMLRMKKEWLGGVPEAGGGVDLEWAEQFMRVRTTRDVRVKALVERCARPVSEKQAFWVAFSKSVAEGGFGTWVRGRMVV
ncbi:autophagy-related 3 [Pyrenophora seminiperda CCB06]|uniref:Autophagy-related 3 n=1 Tax=Pyrenophora seminiperda CCB06 TaxID=1302712 RepID=A0A3M7MBD0_9PLEO|nr:autophagy-related 3 [Pyrenophora seminiperda CCB06]